MKVWQKKLIKVVKSLLEKIGPEHDIDHTERVFNYCLIFSKDYPKTDSESLFAAAYLHDLGYSLGDKRGINHGSSILKKAISILKKVGVPEEKLDLIKQIIEFHSSREDLSKMNLPIEVSIFHDADKAEGVGALGLARQFIYSGRVHKKIWDPRIKRSPSLPYGGDASAMHSILDYHLKHKFYTKTGKKLAKERKKYMKSFVKRFFQEWDFKK